MGGISRANLGVVAAALMLSGCAGASPYGYGGAAITSGSVTHSSGADNGALSTNNYIFDVGMDFFFGETGDDGPLAGKGLIFIESGLWTAIDFAAVRNEAKTAVTSDWHFDQIFYVGLGYVFTGVDEDFKSLTSAYARYGINTLGDAVIESYYELGVEHCPRRMKLLWCGRLGLMGNSGWADPYDKENEYSALGLSASFGARL